MAWLIFVALPIALVVASRFVRPPDPGPRDPLGAGLAADGLFPRGVPREDRGPVVPEEVDAPRFRLD